MKTPIIYFTLFALAPLLFADAQLGNRLEWVEIPEQPDQQILVQRTTDGTLALTPNESFFPLKNLKCEGNGTIEDQADLNKGESFQSITGWKEGASAEWGIWLESSGQLDLKLSSKGKLRFAVSLNGEEVSRLSGDSGTLAISQPGLHILRLTAESGSSDARFDRLTLSGPPAENSGVVRKRWRPAAAHTKFASSKSPEKVRLWIMEMDAVPGELDFYSPITTPFGYYGPSWKADGSVNTSFNFSLWSFRRGAPEPPVERLSHLIAIGDPKARFGGFDHEGTGVKIRGWEPLEGRQEQRQALALRVEPGEIYDTYYSYFFAADEDRWRLFGAGKKWNNNKPISTLWVGSFVEVPGPASVQRTGPYRRTMRYRGWVMDENESWYSINQMQNGNIDKETGLTHSNRGVNADGWFFLEIGGWTFREPPAGGNTIELPSGTPRPEVNYLDPEDLAYLKGLPSEIKIDKLERRGDKARVTYSLRGAGSSPEVMLYWGNNEGLTFVDRWENSTRLSASEDGEHQHVFDIDPSPPLKVRLFLKNKEGQFWSSETAEALP